MSASVQVSKRKPRPRVARRRVEDRARLLSVAARCFAERGTGGVRLEEIAHEAGLSRGTLYSHFRSKEALLEAIQRPVLETAVELLVRVPAGPPRAALDELLRIHLDLWRVGADAMRLAHHSQEKPSPSLAPLHEAFVRRVLEVLAACARAHLLRFDEPVLAARALSMTAVPLLELFTGRPDQEQLFLDALGGLLLKWGER